jgi:hypothetical protein
MVRPRKKGGFFVPQGAKDVPKSGGGEVLIEQKELSL